MAKLRNDLITYTGDLVTDFMKSREGFVGGTYHDVAGLSTAGYGHLITPSDRRAGRFSSGMTEVDASKLLQQDIALHQKPWIDDLKVNVGPAGIAGLTGLAFNAGPTTAAKAVRLLNAGKTKEALAYIASINKTGAVDQNGRPLLDKHGKRVLVYNAALAGRRKDEIAMLQAGLAGTDAAQVYAQEITQKGYNKRDQRNATELADSRRQAPVQVSQSTTVAQAPSFAPTLDSHMAEQQAAKGAADLGQINSQLAQIAQRLSVGNRGTEFLDRLRREGSNAA